MRPSYKTVTDIGTNTDEEDTLGVFRARFNYGSRWIHMRRLIGKIVVGNVVDFLD